MNEQNYNCKITAQIAPEEALQGISDVSAWWATDFEGNSKKLNDIFSVHFGDTFVIFKIVELIADKKIVWHVTDCNLHWLTNKKEWKDTKINWEVSANNNSTQIDMTHIGLVPDIECYNDCKKGWNFYAGVSLLKLLTEGKGLPETPKTSR